MADNAEQQDWPNRRIEILGSTVPIAIISTIFVIWRVVYGLRSKRRLLVCDYLLILATMMNVVTTALRFKTTYHGQGRHIFDPSVRKPYDILEYSYFIWIGQILNLMAVAILKFSICAYLLALAFSKFYLAIVWFSILMVSVFNLFYPFISLLNCRPFEANWNKSIKDKTCWVKGGMTMTYFNGVTNITTDIVYIVAPIIYLSTIQLPKRTQWGLRAVFLISLVPLICSIMKTIALRALTKTRDPTWDGADLSIWSATELSVGILVASLPPLRKQFDNFFRKILPTTGTRSRHPSIPMYGVSKHQTIGSRSRKGTQVAMDDDSERSILPDTGITKTIVHEVTTEERRSTVPMPEATYGVAKSG